MKKARRKKIDSYAHSGKERPNNPPVGLVTPETDPDGETASYRHDPHIDPQLSWAGKTEHTSFEVPTVSLHVHERIDPRTIIENACRQPDPQPSLFHDQDLPIRHAIEFYKHRHNWSNRLIAGDSLLVMNSLLRKEGLGGKVQTVYMDPPYGIRYGSNFQPFVNRSQVVDGRDEDLTREPEQIRAFRDTWELGIHSYLAYLRDRLLLARELLHESGSCFVQIGKENVHRVGVLMDEVFGADNRQATITYATSGSSSSMFLPEVADYLLWYAKNKKKAKFRMLYEQLDRSEVMELFSWHAMVQLPDGKCRKPNSKERFDPDVHLPDGTRIYRRMPLGSQGVSTTGRSEPYEYDGKVFHCGKNRHWSISEKGLNRLSEIGRLEALDGQKSLMWKWYEDEVPGRRINNVWKSQMFNRDKIYAVQTATKTIQRALLMTTDPGDLVLDPTCGSGTTAFIAEEWGRRWITCDTSRVSITLARKRLMTSSYDYFKLSRADEGVGSGFVYKTVPNVSPSILGYDEPPKETVLFDQPEVEKSKARVTGPFTVEAVPSPTVKPIDETGDGEQMVADETVARSGETVRQSDWRDELFKTGIRGKGGQRIGFSRLEPLSGRRWLHCEGETQADEEGKGGKRIVGSFGPAHAPLEQKQVSMALEEASDMVPRPEIVVFAAFQFDPEASKDIDEAKWPGVTLLKAQMNADMLTGDLKKRRASNECFWLIGQPDIIKILEKMGGGDDAAGGGTRFCIKVQGFDYFDITTGNLVSGDADRIACWMLDTDYDGRSLFPRQIFFPMDGSDDVWKKIRRTLNAEIDMERIQAYRGTRSLPFEPGVYRRAAVKIVDDRGIESLKVVDL